MIYIGCLCRVACACSTVFTKGGKQVSRQACGQVDKRETGSHTCGQVDRQAGRHASKRVLLCWNCALVNPKLCCSSCFAFFFVYRFFFLFLCLFIYSENYENAAVPSATAVSLPSRLREVPCLRHQLTRFHPLASSSRRWGSWQYRDTQTNLEV